MLRARINQLEALHTVLRTGSVTRAAEVMRMSQPSVSKLLQDLEQATGLLLFERFRQRLHPTAEGRRLGREAEELFLKLDQIEHVANALRSKGMGELRIAALPALGLSLIPGCIAEFRRDYPEMQVVLSVMPSQRVVETVAAGDADIGFAYPVPGTAATLSRRQLAALPAVAALPRGHSLGARRRLRLSDFADMPIVSLGREDLSRDKMDALVHEAKLRLNVVVETQFAAVACELVAAGAGLAFVDPITANSYRDRLVIRPVTPSFLFDFGALIALGPPRSPLSDHFVTLVADAIGRRSPRRRRPA